MLLRKLFYFLSGFVPLCFLAFFLRNEVRWGASELQNTAKYFGIREFPYYEPMTPKVPNGPVAVLIVTYMRSGSSLTGDIMQQGPEAFYVYEPFRAFGNKNPATFTIMYANDTVRKPPFSRENIYTEALYDWFNCNISKLPVIGLMDPFLNKGKKTSMFPSCMKNEKAKLKNTKYALSVCSRQLQAVCENSPYRIIKTIRVELRNVKSLLESLPNLKIIHLVRDPRATLYSQSSLGMCNERLGGWSGCTSSYCTRLENDVSEEEKLKQKYPTRIMTVMYEDIARHPIETAKKMYTFTGAEFTKEANSYIYNITVAGNPDNCVICTTRSNSTEHITTWKRKMPMDFIKIVNERCNYILKRFNFDEFPLPPKK